MNKERDQLLKCIKVAIEKRQSKLNGLEMVRLFDGHGDGLDLLQIDRLKETLLLHLFEKDPIDTAHLAETLKLLAPEIAQLSACKTIYLRWHRKDAKDSASESAYRLFGEATPELVCNERGLLFQLKPEEQVNAGFFIDMREVRAWLINNSREKRVMNTFCFTGSLGIAAYAGGAKEVVQVDISKGILGWARANFTLNQHSGIGEMRFVPEDSLTYLLREERRIINGSPRYDIVVIDPPSYGSTKGVRFSILKDLPKLVDAAIKILEVNGTLIVTCNHSELGSSKLRQICSDSLKRLGIAASEIELLSRPGDFTADEKHTKAMRGVRVCLGI